MDNSDQDQAQAKRRNALPPWAIMAGLIALVFQTELGWTLIIKCVQTMNRADAPASLQAWRHIILVYVLVAVVVSIFSYFSFRDRNWRGIVWSCMSWLGLSFVAFAIMW